MNYGFNDDKEKVEVVEKVVLNAQATVAANSTEYIYFSVSTLANHGIIAEDYEKWFIIGIEQKIGDLPYKSLIIDFENHATYPNIVTFDDIGGLCIDVKNYLNVSQTVKLRVALMKVEE